MNNKGFAITTILYGMLILFLILLVSMLGILASYKDRLSLLMDSNNGAREILNAAILPEPEKPVLDGEMIPVVISNDGTVKTVNKDSNNWYNYSRKKWANAVLINDNHDISGNNTTNTISGPTKEDGGLKFDGKPDFVRLQQDKVGSMTSGFTVEVEMKVNKLNSYQQWVFANVQNGGFGIKINSDGYISFQARDSSSYKYVTGTSKGNGVKVVVGTRYLITGVYNGSSITLYVDGNKIASANIGKVISPENSTRTFLGCDPKGTSCTQDNEYFKGTIFSARFYTKALTDDEIAQNKDKNIVTDSLSYNFDFEHEKRSLYKGTNGKEVAPKDILAYYVWIPRYKYNIWTETTSDTGKEQPIKIMFEKKDSVQSLGTKVGEWRTHPAFTWGDNAISGIWVGKFETSGDESKPTILPGIASLKSQNISTQFKASLKFAGGTLSGSTVSFAGNSSYGLSNNADSHLIKNSEWGAVTYLSHSRYGINDEIRNNNTTGYITGCGAETKESNDIAGDCEVGYGSGVSSYPQSTTGNISGIFDMAGGVWESVMANYNGAIGSAGFTSLPSSKYYDLYKSEDSLTACGGNPCYGHALFETNKWYGDTSQMVYSSYKWLLRSGSTNSTYGSKSAGIFVSAPVAGGANSSMGWRSVLITG